MKIHDRLREWTRVVHNRYPRPSEAIIDSQSVKSAAMVSEAIGFDAGKLVKGRKRFLTVDTLGLVLRVLVTAANVGEREGGKRVLKRVKQMGKAVSRLHPIWAVFWDRCICPKITAVARGFDGAPFIQWVMDICRWTQAAGVASSRAPRLCLAS